MNHRQTKADRLNVDGVIRNAQALAIRHPNRNVREQLKQSILCLFHYTSTVEVDKTCSSFCANSYFDTGMSDQWLSQNQDASLFQIHHGTI
jgi:hypothetical protein